MKKKCFIFLILFFIVGIGISTLFIINNKSKISIDSKYYGKGSLMAIGTSSLPQGGNYLLYVHNTFCIFPVSCESIFKEYAKEEKIDILTIEFDEFKKTKFYETVKFAPSVLIISNNKIVAYLSADKDEDIDRYQNVNSFRNWINSYVK